MSEMYLELAKQWLKSNGYQVDDLDVYFIRKTNKWNQIYEGNLIHKSSSFEIYHKIIEYPKPKKSTKTKMEQKFTWD